jgi:outer membrane protein TolC
MRLVLSLRKRLIATAIFSCFAEQAGAQSLDEVVVTVVRSHPVVESVRAQSRAAEQRIAEEEGALLPRVDLSGAAGEEFTNNRLTRLRAKDHDTLGLPGKHDAASLRRAG